MLMLERQTDHNGVISEMFCHGRTEHHSTWPRGVSEPLCNGQVPWLPSTCPATSAVIP